RSRITRLGVGVLVAGGLIGVAIPASAVSGFTAGDLVVYQVGGITSAASAVSLVEYGVSGLSATPSGFSVSLPTTDSLPTHALVESGSALNDGELTLSADGTSLIATGYDATVGTTSITSSKVPRTIAVVSSTGTVDTSTSLTDSTVENNNFRSAAADSMPVSGSTLWTGSGGGLGVTTDGGTTTSNYLTADKVHEVQIVGGQLYESTTKNINEIGTGLPTTGTPTDTALLSGANLTANFGPDQFAFVNLSGGSTPDTLYVADGSNGATSGDPDAVEKYSLESGVWTATGSITVPLAVGLAVSVTGGVANIYVTGATATSAAANTVLYGITDSSGFAGTLSGTATQLATAPTGSAFKGLAFSPVGTPGTGTPEVPLALVLPLGGGALLAGYVVYRRRYGTSPAA
ncbi:MAG TPA: hypothetical protein VMF60_01005, partial [Acidimicrobiales bacterium]|nr:hypothetical protein [Acidimicrobiales bacterium]